MDNTTPEIKFVTDDIRQKSEKLVLQPLQKAPQQGFFDLLIKEETSKRKMQDFSDVKFTDIYAKLEDDSYIAKFPSYSTSGGNQEEYFAEQQTTGEKWKNGAIKFLGQTATGLVGGTVGILNGAYEFAKTGSFASTYDNDFSNYLDGLNKKWDYQLPNYYTQAEKDASLTDSFGSANFWAKDVLGGAAFTVSAIGSEAIWAWATGGTSLATTAARIGSRLGKSGRIGEAILGSGDDILKAANLARTETKLPILTTGSSLYKNVKVPTQLASGLGKAGELANTARFTYTSAGFEAGFEARHYMREMEDNFYHDFQAKNNGEMPSYEQETDFRKNLGESANALYGFNLAVVGLSNLATIGRIYNIKSPLSAPSKWSNSKLFGVGVKSTGGELTQVVATKTQKIAQNLYTWGKSPIVEGVWEEGMQSVGSNTAKNWVEAGYNPALTKETYDLGQASIDGFAETYGTKEGWKEIGVGMIIGLLTGSGITAIKGGELKGAKEEAANLENFSKYYSPKKMAESIAYANRTQEANKNAQDAESKGDFTSAELSRKSAVLSQLNFAYNLDYLKDTIKETSIAIDNIDNASLMREYDVDEAGAEVLRQKMKSEYVETAKNYKKNRDFSEYFIGQRAGKEGLSQAETSNLKQAIAYELTLGSEAYKFSSDILTSLKEKIASGYTDSDITSAMDIDNILSTASVNTKQEFRAKQNEIIQISANKIQLEKEKDNLLKVLLDESQEQKVARLQKLNNVTVELQELEVQEERLGREVNATLAAAQLNNPFNITPSQQYLTSEQIKNLDTNLDKVKDLSNAFRNSDPQKSLEIDKLREEYGRSIDAFQRYADLSRQLADPKLGLRGKRNIISEIRSSKTPNEITVETLEGLTKTREQLKVEGAERILGSSAVVADKIEDIKKDVATMEVTPVVTATTEDLPVKTPLESIKSILKLNPYLISYKGNGIPSKPTEQEIDEYYNLATRAITEDEENRLAELNEKMSDWQLYGGAVNSENLSITDIIEQQLLLDQVIEEEVEIEVTEDELGQMTNPEPKEVQGDEVRNEELGQTYSRVFVRATKEGYVISNLGIQKFLDSVDIADTVVVTIAGKTKNILRSDVGQYSAMGSKFTITFRDGIEAEIIIDAGGVIKTSSFNKIIENSQYKTDRYILGKQSGYSLLYDGDTQVESDFKRIDDTLEYKDVEFYNMPKGESVGFKINLNDPYNKQLLDKYRKKEITKEQFEASIKIYIVDDFGNILGDVKANRDIMGVSPTFLKLRALASQRALSKDALDDIELPYRASIKHLFLGSPNFEFTATGYREFDLNADTVVDFGYIENGELVLNGQTKEVRKDLISKILNKDGTPIIVFKQGVYNIAFPVKLIKTSKNLGQKVEDILSSSTTPAIAVVEINKLLIENKLSPKTYNLYYTDAQSQTLFENDGSFSPNLNKIIADLEKKQDFVNPRSWQTVQEVVNSAVINIDLENNPIVSPKPVLDYFEAPMDVYERFQNGEDLTDEDVTIFATKLAEDQIENAKTKAEIAEDIKLSDEAISLARQRIEQASTDKAKLDFTEGFEKIDTYSYRSTRGTVWIVPNNNPTFTNEEEEPVKFIVLREEKLFNSWKRADNKRINDIAKNPIKRGEIERAFTEKITGFLFDNSEELLTEIPKATYSKKDALLATNFQTSIANNLETIEKETDNIQNLEDKLKNTVSGLSERDLTITSDKKVQKRAKEIFDINKEAEAQNNLKKPC